MRGTGIVLQQIKLDRICPCNSETTNLLNLLSKQRIKITPLVLFFCVQISMFCQIISVRFFPFIMMVVLVGRNVEYFAMKVLSVVALMAMNSDFNFCVDTCIYKLCSRIINSFCVSGTVMYTAVYKLNLNEHCV